MRRSVVIAVVALLAAPASLVSQERPRAREAGVIIGVFPAGAQNAITDVAGVRVGHYTLRDDSVNTGVTAILPHGGNVFRERVPAAILAGNGFGKLLGVTQVRELGELETPVLLTCTLCVWRAADAMVDWLLRQSGMQNVRSINPVVGETNDGGLNNIRSRPIEPAHVEAALDNAGGGAVQEGAVGAGAGTVAFGWKGGIGTSSRVLPAALGGYTVGVLVQTNFGGILTINGAPVGRELGRYSFRDALERPAVPGGTVNGYSLPATRDTGSVAPAPDEETPDGSIMIVVATDAPLDARNLERLARRALFGLARTGATMSNGSGDYVIAFSTAESVRRTDSSGPRTVEELPNDRVSPLFQAVAEATEEAIVNSLFRAVDTTGMGRTVEALPIDRVIQVLEKYNALRWDATLLPGR